MSGASAMYLVAHRDPRRITERKPDRQWLNALSGVSQSDVSSCMKGNTNVLSGITPLTTSEVISEHGGQPIPMQRSQHLLVEILLRWTLPGDRVLDMRAQAGEIQRVAWHLHRMVCGFSCMRSRDADRLMDIDLRHQFVQTDIMENGIQSIFSSWQHHFNTQHRSGSRNGPLASDLCRKEVQPATWLTDLEQRIRSEKKETIRKLLHDNPLIDSEPTPFRMGDKKYYDAALKVLPHVGRIESQMDPLQKETWSNIKKMSRLNYGLAVKKSNSGDKAGNGVFISYAAKEGAPLAYYTGRMSELQVLTGFRRDRALSFAHLGPPPGEHSDNEYSLAGDR